MIGLSWAQAKSKASFEVTGEEPVMLKLGYGTAYAGKKILPEHVTAFWDLRGGKWFLEEVKVSGSVIKADETPGKTDTTRIAFGQIKYGESEYRWSDDAPEWLIRKINLHDPQLRNGV